MAQTRLNSTSSTIYDEVSPTVAVNPSFDGVYALIDHSPAPYKSRGAVRHTPVSKYNVTALVIAVLIVILLLLLSILCAFILFEISELRTVPLTSELQNTTSTPSEHEQISNSIQMLNSSVNALNELMLDGCLTHGKELNSSIVDFVLELLQNVDAMDFEMEPMLEALTTYNDQALGNLEKKMTYSTKTLERLEELLNSSRNDLDQQYQQLIQNLLAHRTEIHELNISLYDQILQIFGSGQFPTFPTSCAALPPSSPSGYYWVASFYGSAVRVYCDMTRSCGGVAGGWTRVFELDMTNSSQQCPSGLRLNASNLRTCRHNSDEAGCSQVILPTSRLQYSRVCGRIKAYQVGTPDTFHRGQSNLNIDDNYVDGVSLTQGNPRQHIWTFAAGHEEVNRYPISNCPCLNGGTSVPPSFLANDYFCDTGSSNAVQLRRFYSTNPLWDGAGCGSSNTCCSFNTPPWFYKQLPQPTTDDIEMRVCRDESQSNEDTAIEIIEIYIQ